jgi:DNA-binding response OmpR family regulator
VDSSLVDQLKHYTLLFVENEAGIRENFSEYFNLLFKEVYIAVDGADGYAQYEIHKPDLIITDIKMPNMDGIEMVKKMRKHDQTTSIVIISAHTDVDFLLQSIPLNLIQYMVKPLNQEKLHDLFEKFIDERESGRFFYDKEKSETVVEGVSYTLSLKENQFLDKIINHNRIISYEEIELDIWNGKEMSQNALRLFIRNLRKKLPEAFIKNIPNHGYAKAP